MITCQRVEDFAPVIAYLRRDVFANVSLLMGLERNIPGVPRQVWAARQADESVAGVLAVTEFPHGECAEIEATSRAAIPAMLDCLDPDQEYHFAIRGSLWQHVHPRLLGAAPPSRSLFLTLSGDDLRPCDCPGEVRPLSTADKTLTDRFPPPAPDSYEPSLSQFVESAERRPGREAVFGVIVGEHIMSYVQWSWHIDNIWGQHIRTHHEHRRKGYAKAVLSHSSADLLEKGIVPLYDVGERNLASLRTAQAAGYREAFRVFGFSGKVKSESPS